VLSPWLHGLIITEDVTIAAAVPTVWLGLLEHCRDTGQALVGSDASSPAARRRLRR
jgi:hypothetical protein